METCPKCNGDETIECPKCEGTGLMSPGPSADVADTDCVRCNGSGEVNCPKCKGKGEL
jgi:DnaJ-class molecular chaperone